MAGLFALITAIFSFACASDPQIAVSPPEQEAWSAPSSTPCEYFNFGIVSDFSGKERPSGLTNEETLLDVEEAFSREFQAVGFHRAVNGEKPWLFLEALLQKSLLSSNAISGAVRFESTPSLHRDYLLSRSKESVPPSDIGMILVTEIPTRWNRVDPAVELDKFARVRAEWVWSTTAPALFKMCAWKAQLIEDGLSVEDLRRELVKEIERIRREHREINQQKKLQLEVEQ